MSRNNGDKARFGKDRKQRIKTREKIRELRKTVTTSERPGSQPGNEAAGRDKAS